MAVFPVEAGGAASGGIPLTIGQSPDNPGISQYQIPFHEPPNLLGCVALHPLHFITVAIDFEIVKAVVAQFCERKGVVKFPRVEALVLLFLAISTKGAPEDNELTPVGHVRLSFQNGFDRTLVTLDISHRHANSRKRSVGSSVVSSNRYRLTRHRDTEHARDRL